MIKSRLSLSPGVGIALALALPAVSASGFLGAEEVRTLVTDRTWAIAWTRDLANPLTVAHWDFRRDGTVCARFLGGKSKDPCADDGRWQISGDALCWELQRIGESYGYKKACMQVRKLDERRYEGVPSDGKLHPPLFTLLR